MIAGGSAFFGFDITRCLAEKEKEVVLVQRHPIQAPPLLTSFWGKEVNLAIGDTRDLVSIMAEYRAVSVERMKEEFGFVPLNITQGVKAYVDFVSEGRY